MRVSFYFAYGSNLDEPQLRTRCPEALVISEACLKGYRLDFTRYSSGWNCGVADIVRDEESEVWGVIYKITDSDFKALDHYEGYPDLYTRFQTNVETPSGPLQGIWVYTVGNKQTFVPPSKEYLRIIKRASVQYYFPAHYQESLERIPIRGSSA
jgi:gamma-glutamylcyclotransferase (GGCT)/AIG2-like uncharacterized protein YtfP